MAAPVLTVVSSGGQVRERGIEMQFRVLRLLEYTYSEPSQMQHDMENWKVQGVYSPNVKTVIRSVALPFDLLDDPDE